MKTIAYYRVSTVQQKISGLGLEAQQATVRDYLKGEPLLAEYQETESGRKTDRPQLRAALEHCQRTGARLVIAKVDRLARHTRFLLALIDSGVEITFCDMPEISGPAGRMMLTMMAGFAEMESALISERTVLALKAARARGVKLGAQPGKSPLQKYLRENGNGKACRGATRAADSRAEVWRSTITTMLADGLGNTAIAGVLNGRGEPSVSGAGQWTAKQIRRLRARLDSCAPA